jgi:hypothetical protein
VSRIRWLKLATILGETAALLYFLLIASSLVRTTARLPWDFDTYRYASIAATKDLNPYRREDLTLLADHPVGMPFVYPPITVPMFRPFAAMRVTEARVAWLALNVIALACLLQLWRRQFLSSVPLLVLSAAMAFGFSGSAVWGLKTGNVAILEQLLLWLGFTAYARGRIAGSAACIVAGSMFKLLPIVFLALLVLPINSRKTPWKIVAISLLGFLVLVFGPIGFGPPWARSFLHDLPAERPWSLVNPSALGLIDTLLGRHSGSLLSASFASLALWLGFAAALLLASATTLRRAWNARDPVSWIMIATVLFVLLHPRPMVYSYLFTIPAMLYLVSPVFRSGGSVITAAVLSAQALWSPALGLTYRDPWTPNLPFLFLLSLWLVYVLGHRMGARGRAAESNVSAGG